ncbi:hypothetical protein VZ94_04755, partial [Methylocucumis oryzae]
MRILVTGARGFIGTQLSLTLAAKGYEVIGCSRSMSAVEHQSCFSRWYVKCVDAHTDWHDALSGVDVVVHLAARAHVSNTSPAALAELDSVNVQGSLNLARQASERGVKRFIFISSIKVNGDTTLPGCAVTADSPAQPGDAYARSKYEAEQGLQAIASQSGMEWLVIRPPLVYGLGVQANFYRLVYAVKRGWPLPFAAVNNQRSLVFVGNLVDLIIHCLSHLAAKNRVFLVSDGEDWSTPTLIRLIAEGLNVTPRLFFVPISWLEQVFSVLGRRALYERLCGNLVVDMTKTCEDLAWHPITPGRNAL